MGLDFITRCTPTFQRSWDQGRQHLVQQDLFTHHPALQGRTFRLSPTNGNDFVVGQELVVRCLDGKLVAYEGRAQVGVFNFPPPALVEALQKTGLGIACARIDKIHSHSKAADVILQ
jgi:hypothetical protein